MTDTSRSEAPVLQLPSPTWLPLAWLFVLAAAFAAVIARFAAPAGDRLSLFLVLLAAAALLVAGVYAYAARRLSDGADPAGSELAAADAQAQHGAELERLLQALDQMRLQLDAAVADNDELRSRISRSADTAVSAGQGVDAALALTHERLIYLDGAGIVQAITPATLQMLHVSEKGARGKPLHAVVRVYDIDKDPTRQRPSEEMVLRTAQGQTGAQSLPRAMLVFGPEDEKLLPLTIMPLNDTKGELAGAILRFDGDGRAAATAVATAAVAAAGTEHEPAARGGEKDSLTGMPGLHAFDARLSQLLEIARLTHVSHTLLLLSLDDLDSAHRQFGTGASEEMLLRVSELVNKAIEPVGTAFRTSLYTFAALIPDMGGDPARELAETLRADIAGCVLHKNNRQFNTTASIALVEFNEWTEGPDVLMEQANGVLLEAGVAGGNRVLGARKEATRSSTRRDDQEWIDWLNPRFERQQIHLVSQSIVPSTRLEGSAKPWVEVFVRVEEDDGHWLPPGAYLPALRRNRLTGKLDLWVLQQCLQAITFNRELFEKYAGVSINLDSASVASDEFRDQAAELFADSPMGGAQICFEIEEATVANQTTNVLALIEAVKAHNVHFLLDHCRGTSTVGLLRKVPVEFVKFHESLVRRAMSDPLDRAEMEWLIQAAHLLNRKTIASHVESKELRELMTRVGIDYMQGLAIDQLGPLLI